MEWLRTVCVQVEMQIFFGLYETASTADAPTAKTNHKDETTKEQYSYMMNYIFRISTSFDSKISDFV